MFKMDLALHNLQRLICHKTQTNKQTIADSKYFFNPPVFALKVSSTWFNSLPLFSLLMKRRFISALG